MADFELVYLPALLSLLLLALGAVSWHLRQSTIAQRQPNVALPYKGALLFSVSLLVLGAFSGFIAAFFFITG